MSETDMLQLCSVGRENYFTQRKSRAWATRSANAQCQCEVTVIQAPECPRLRINELWQTSWISTSRRFSLVFVDGAYRARTGDFVLAKRSKRRAISSRNP